MKNRSLGFGGAVIVLLIMLVAAYFGVDILGLLPGDTPQPKVEPLPGSTPLPTLEPVREAESEPSDPTAAWYEIYFTNPTCPPEEERSGGLDEYIAADLAQAETQVDIAAFDLDAEPIVNALITLEGRGVKVRVVTDEDNAELSSIRRLRRNGISVIEDKRRALMHNKFIVVDGRFLWVGSMNFTTNGVYCNNNNIVRFDAPELAANYTTEMDEMYEQQLFGPDSPNNTPHEQLVIHGVQVENYFSPEKEVAPIIARAVARAQQEILILAFTFTDDQIGEAILGRADAGIPVRGVFETAGADIEFSYYTIMKDAGIANVEVRKDGNSRVMHHKVIIIDRETVIFGSFNFSDSANRRNDENIIIVHDPTFTSFFVEEFGFVWDEAVAGNQ